MRYPPSQNTMGVSPWMNANGRSSVALAKEDASADFAEEMKDTTGVSLWRLHFCFPSIGDIFYLRLDNCVK